MKKTLVLIAALVGSAVALGQGSVNFNTTKFAIGGDTGAVVLGSDGAPVAGDAAWAQLYAGADAGSLAPIGDPVNFMNVAGFEGLVASTAVAVPGVAAGADAVVEMRAWLASGGNSYEEAAAALADVGISNQITVTTGGAGSPPSLPGNLVGMEGFSLAAIPEPSAAALGLLGAVALLLRRRK